MKPKTIKKKPALAAPRKTSPFKKTRKVAEKPVASKDENQVEDASDPVLEREVVVNAVKQLRADHSEEGRAVFLQVNVAKVPNVHTTIVHLPLKHRILPADAKMVLITPDLKGDLKPDEKNVEHYKKLLADKGIKSFSEVIPLHKFRAEYKDNDSQKKLLKLYDLIIYDVAIAKIVGRLFNNTISRGDRHFAGLKLRATNLKGALEKLLASSQMNIHGKGSSFIVNAGHTGMEDEVLVDNVLAAAAGIKAKYPGGFEQIVKLALKTPKSSAVEVYKSLAHKEVKVEKAPTASPKQTQKKEAKAKVIKAKVVKKAVKKETSEKAAEVPTKKVAIKRKNTTDAKESKVVAKKKGKGPVPA